MPTLPAPIPRTWTPGETEVGAYLNGVRDGLNYLLNRPFAVLYTASAQTLTSGASPAVTFDASLVDTYGGHSNSTNNTRYTAQVAGWYELSGMVCYQPNSSGTRYAYFLRNGAFANPSAYVRVPALSSGSTQVPPETLQLFLNVGDYVELIASQDSGSNVLTQAGAGNATRMTVKWIHA